MQTVVLRARGVDRRRAQGHRDGAGVDKQCRSQEQTLRTRDQVAAERNRALLRTITNQNFCKLEGKCRSGSTCDAKAIREMLLKTRRGRLRLNRWYRLILKITWRSFARDWTRMKLRIGSLKDSSMRRSKKITSSRPIEKTDMITQRMLACSRNARASAKVERSTVLSAQNVQRDCTVCGKWVHGANECRSHKWRSSGTMLTVAEGVWPRSLVVGTSDNSNINGDQ